MLLGYPRSQISKAMLLPGHIASWDVSGWRNWCSHQILDVSVMSGYEGRETPVHLEYMRYYDKLNGANRRGEAAEQREDRRDPKRACRGTRPRVIVQGRPRLSKPVCHNYRVYSAHLRPQASLTGSTSSTLHCRTKPQLHTLGN